MANGGNFNTSGYKGRYLRFSWIVDSQSIENNYTTISWSLDSGGGTTTDWYITGNIRLVIDGETVYKSADTIKLYGNTHVASGKKKLWHIENGNRSFSASASAGIYNWGSTNVSGSNIWALPSIPRKAALVSAPNFDDEQNPTINYSNPAGGSASLLQACISLTGANADIAYKDIPKTGSSYTFNLSQSERDVLRNNTSGKSREIKFLLKTVIGGQTYITSLVRTFSIVNGKPTLNTTVVDTNQKTIDLTGSNTKVVRYHSNIQVSSGAKAIKGATVKSQKVENGSRVINSGSGTFNKCEIGNFKFTVTDSRGFVSTANIDRAIVYYISPTCNATVKSEIEPGNTAKLTTTVKGNFFNGSFGKVYNTLKVEFRWKKDGGYWTGWEILTPSKSGNTYTATKVLSGLDYKASYTIDAKVTDSLETRSSPFIQARALPVYDWDASSFNFNVPLYYLGNPMDFVIKQGNSGGWSYRKWNSGRAECWGTQVFENLPCQTAWGSLYETAYCGKKSYPFPFVYTPIEYKTIGACYGASAILESGHDNTTTMSGDVSFCRATPTTFKHIELNYYVVGLWK